MYVVDVIPLSSTAPAGTLSYRSAKKLAPGRIVSVKLRRRHVPGIVVGAIPLIEAKAMLKAASFILSGDIVAEGGSLPEELMDAIERIAAWHAASRGAVLAALFLELIRSDSELTGKELTPGSGYALEPIELPLRKRASRYRTAISESLALGRSALLVVSTLAEVEFWKKELGAFTPLVLSGTLTGARRKAMLKRAEDARTLVIATPSFAWVPMAHLGLVIMDRVGAGAYRQLKRPYLDTRVALLELARARELPCMLGDFPLPLEYRAGVRRLAEPEGAIEVLDARKDESLPALEDEPWTAIPKKMCQRLEAALDAGGRAVVLAVRKGYAPVVVCRDCGETLKDERGNAYSFSVTRAGERTFRTADGKSVIGTNITCPRCASWNLLPLGVGVERVHEELIKLFPNRAILLFDADAVRTAARAKRELEAFTAPGSILVGTEAMLPWLLATLPQPVDLACVASADTLLALPFWRARERFVRLGHLLAEIARETSIATRMPDDTAVRQLTDPANGPFFAEETKLRKALGYPPFGTLISLQFEGRQAAVEKLSDEVRERVGDLATVRTIPDRAIGGGATRRTLVLALAKDLWPNANLSSRLAALPPSVRVMVDPESFW